MSRRPPQLSHKHMANKGWERVDARPWGKLAARWRHAEGWWLEHCGHPTAHWPLALYDPKGRLHCTGLWAGGTNPTHGTAFPDLAAVVEYVDTMGARAIQLMNRAWVRLPRDIRAQRSRRTA